MNSEHFLLIYLYIKSYHIIFDYRYSGRTQKQMQDFVRENFVKRQSFQR